MSKIINKIKEIWSIFKNATKHQIWLSAGTFICMFIFDLLGAGILASVIFGAFVGVVIEMMYCFVPSKEVKLLGITFNVPDFKLFKSNWVSDNFILYHKIEANGIYFNITAIILYFVLKMIFVIVF